MIRLLLADDHTIVRDGLKRVLGGFTDLQVVAEADSGTALLDKVRRGGCDIVMTDLTMPGRDGIELIRQLRRESPKLPILVLTMHPAEQFAVRAIRAGANGYLTKDVSADELAAAIRKVAAGGLHLTTRVSELLALEVMPSIGESPHRDLTDREFQVFQMLTGGQTVGQIAERLSLSIKTVSTHKARILQKIGVASLADLVRYAISHGLAPDQFDR